MLRGFPSSTPWLQVVTAHSGVHSECRHGDVSCMRALATSTKKHSCGMPMVEEVTCFPDMNFAGAGWVRALINPAKKNVAFIVCLSTNNCMRILESTNT